MQYNYILTKKTEKRLLDMAQKVADEKISTRFLEYKTRPHITLARFNNVNEEICIKKLKEFAGSHQIMPAYIGSIGMFTDTKNDICITNNEQHYVQFSKRII